MPSLKVLVVPVSLRNPGGAEAVGAWMLQALQENHQLTLLTLDPVDVPVVNRRFGTTLDASKLRVERASPLLAAALAALPLPLDLLRNQLLYRRCRELMLQHDVVINATNEAWLGRPSIQYVHFPWAFEPRRTVALRWYHRVPGLLSAYHAVCGRLQPPEPERMRENLMLVNSEFTGGEVRARYGGSTTTVYPPVRAAAELPWDERDDAFLCIGRIAPEKQLETVVQIVARLRLRRPQLRLSLAGGRVRLREDYYRRIRQLAEANASWLTLIEDPDRTRLETLIARHRYGIHGMRGEHFGMAPAEMARAGCLVFVHDSGGQREVVGGEPRLVYASEADAVQKIEAVLDDDAAQTLLRTQLRAHSERFSTEAFTRTIRSLVDTWPSRGPS